jgi:hypothetical protein
MSESNITVQKLRSVAWCNIWNRSLANNSDGYGTKSHLTESEGVAGKTLCGRSFPRDKGYPSTWGAGYCKRCINKALAKGHQPGFTKGLESVPSREDS